MSRPATIIDEADLLLNELREGRRSRKQAQQEFNRLKAFDANRFVESEIVKESDIAGLCSRIKRRKAADAADLVKLGTAFLQSEDNILAFLKVIGAIDVIVKEFTSNVRSQQILAAQCLCNMSLGNEFCCTRIASTAGVYLMIYMIESTDHFARICSWTLQNIAASGEKPLNILMSQELLSNCLEILPKNCLPDEAIKLLDIVIDAKWSSFRVDEKLRVQKAIWPQLEVSFSDPLLLQIFLKTLPENLYDCHGRNTEHIIEILVQQLKISTYDCDLMYFIAKTLGRLCHDNRQLMTCFAELSMLFELSLSSLINQATSNPKLFPAINELAHLASLFFKPEHQDITGVVTYRWTDLLPERFSIPKLFEFSN